MDLSIFLEYVDFSVHVYKFIALQTCPLRQGNLFHTVHPSLFLRKKWYFSLTPLNLLFLLLLEQDVITEDFLLLMFVVR